jgi:NTE family protein
MQNKIHRLTRACLLCLFLALSACAPLIADHPLEKWTPEMDSDIRKKISGDRSGELLVFLAFSGGGTRAAAFSYGVLQELAETEVVTEKGTRALIKEVDMISSVSGGSFTSAYYGLYGDRIFEDFETRFLRKNVQGALLLQLLNPVNWFRLMTPSYGRGEMAASYYSKNIFDGATFANLKRPDAPLVIINATDLPDGVRVSFTDWMFHLLCIDLNAFPVSRAVAASSAVPVLFNPIVIKNHAGICGDEPPQWLHEAAAREEKDTIRRVNARAYLKLADAKARPWLHLVDGGISDNLGLRSIFTTAKLIGNREQALHAFGHPNVRQILIISVNAHAEQTPKWAFADAAPGIAAVIGSMSSVQIDQYTADTLAAVRFSFERWAQEASTPEHPIRFNFVELDFEKAADEADRNYLNHIGTSFNLKDEEVDRLIAAGREILRQSMEFKAFLDANQKSY